MAERTLEGTALHRGVPARVTLSTFEGPITFVQRGQRALLGELSPVSTDRAVALATADGRLKVELVEHLLAALGGLGVRDGVRVDVEDELPLLDGGARAFCEALVAIGAKGGSPPRLEIARPATLAHETATFEFAPGEDVVVEVNVSFRRPVFSQTARWAGEPEDFAKRIARARTFAWRDEVLALRSAGRAMGDVAAAAVVFDDEGSITTPLDGADEPARHKLLDLIGDLALYGGPPRGRIVARRPGHRATHAVARAALELGVLRRVGAAALSLAILAGHPTVARAEEWSPIDAPAPPTLNALVHTTLSAAIELTTASIAPADGVRTTGRAYAWFVHAEVEYPIVPAKWYLGVAEDLAGGEVPGVGDGTFLSSPEIWVRGIWASRQGLSSGGGLGIVVPAPHHEAGASLEVLDTVRVARPWDALFFDPLTLTLRPWLDVRHVAGRAILQLRLGLDAALALSEPAKLQNGADFTAVGCFYAGARATKWLGLGMEVWETYAITADVQDDKRAAFALSPGLRLMLPRFEPALSVLFPISTPLRGQAASYFAVRFNMSFEAGTARR